MVSVGEKWGEAVTKGTPRVADGLAAASRGPVKVGTGGQKARGGSQEIK